MQIIADLHTHTLSATHAFNTLDEMAAKAAALGYAALAITDHGPAMPDAPHMWHFANQTALPLVLHGVAMMYGAEANVMDTNGGLDFAQSRLRALDWVVASMGTASPEDVRQVSIGLLTMPNTNDFEWWAAGDFRALNELYRTLRLGPYAFLRDFSVHAVIERYKGPLLFAAALMVLFLLNELRVHVLVRRRTKELSDALMERDANAQSIRELQKQLGEVERVGAVSQLSSMIAHELKQPVASIINFSAALSVRLGGLLKAHPECAAGLCTIRAESERISEIISRVRQYAKHRPVSAAPCSLSAAVRKAVLVYRNGEGGRIPVEVTETENVWVVADELELELLVLNLIRNAAQAQTHVETPYIRIHIERSASEVQLTVEDNGPALSDAEFLKLSHAQTSMKPDGLGLGLEITRSIAARSDAMLVFERKPERGLLAIVRFPLKLSLNGTAFEERES